MTARAALDAEVSAAMIALRVAELRVLAAATAVLWGRSPTKSFEQIASAAHRTIAQPPPGESVVGP